MTREQRIILDMWASNYGMDSQDVDVFLAVAGFDPQACTVERAGRVILKAAMADADEQALDGLIARMRAGGFLL